MATPFVCLNWGRVIVMSACHQLSYRGYISRVHTEFTAELSCVLGPRERAQSCCSKSDVGMRIPKYM